MPADPRAERNVRVFGATSFLNDTATEMSYWVLPAFLSTLGAGPAQLGIIEGIAESVASFSKLLSGYLTDRFARRKPLVVFGYAVANLAKPLLALATSWHHVLVVRFADRTAKGLRGAPRDVMLAESVPRGRLGASFGLLQAMDSAGAIAGPLLALAILSHFSLRGVFWAAAVPGLLSIAVVAMLARETGAPRSVTTATGAPKAEASADPAALPASFYWMLAAITLFSLGNSSDMFLILRAQQAGIAPVYAPLLGLVFNLVYTAASWPAGRLSDRVSRRALAAAGYLVFAVVYAVFAAAPSHLLLWLMMGGYGLYYALTSPVLRALVAETIAPEVRGRAFGILYFVTSIATLLASLITGFLWDRFGAALPFYLSAGLAIVSAVMLVMRSPRTED
ncbi:MAG TPA: MFS transporter [Terriglobales bacterium]|nr:MFS transporter [Terriglobales bacterium]